MHFSSIIQRRFFPLKALHLLVLQITYPTSLCDSDTSSSNFNQSNQDDLKFHGDIIVPPPERTGRMGGSGIGRAWAGGVIPYIIENTFGDDTQAFVTSLMQNYNTLTNGCIRFVVRDREPDFLLIRIHDAKCASQVGNRGGVNILVLGPNCLNSRTILHELYHVVGFVHEQERVDRDRYVTIHYNNIMEQEKHNFHIVKEIPTYGISYDYRSIVHYNQFAFSKNGQITISTKDPAYQHIIGTINGLSQKDILRIRSKYRCP